MFDGDSYLPGYLLIGACLLSAGTMLHFITGATYPHWHVPFWLMLLLAIVFTGAVLRFERIRREVPYPAQIEPSDAEVIQG